MVSFKRWHIYGLGLLAGAAVLTAAVQEPAGVVLGLGQFLVSGLLMTVTALRVARWGADSAVERFWFFFAALLMQISFVSILLSLFHQLRPFPWLLTQVALGLASLRLRPRGTHPSVLPLPPFAPLRPSPGIAWAGMAGLGLLLLSAAERIREPLWFFDDLSYHAPRVLYWIQNQSLLPFETHDLRQVVLPFGSELFFLWPILVRGEAGDFPGLPFEFFGQDPDGRRIRFVLTGGVVFPDGTRASRADEDAAPNPAVGFIGSGRPGRASRSIQGQEAQG